MTRTIVPGDFERADPWTTAYFSQMRSICKAQTRFRNSGYKRKFDKKKGKEGKQQKLPSIYCTPDVKRLVVMPLAEAEAETAKGETRAPLSESISKGKGDAATSLEEKAVAPQETTDT
mmetsp:Transcript_6574/g.11361  ORF Transcript_6574/g.11361 Transcript_6574/m.11361 type:complete len:118 (+) Transcript_6574:111-464(+)